MTVFIICCSSVQSIPSGLLLLNLLLTSLQPTSCWEEYSSSPTDDRLGHMNCSGYRNASGMYTAAFQRCFTQIPLQKEGLTAQVGSATGRQPPAVRFFKVHLSRRELPLLGSWPSQDSLHLVAEWVGSTKTEQFWPHSGYAAASACSRAPLCTDKSFNPASPFASCSDQSASSTFFTGLTSDHTMPPKFHFSICFWRSQPVA